MVVELPIDTDASSQRLTHCRVSYTEERAPSYRKCTHCQCKGDRIAIGSLTVDAISGSILDDHEIARRMRARLEKIYWNRAVCEDEKCKIKFDNGTLALIARKNGVVNGFQTCA